MSKKATLEKELKKYCSFYRAYRRLYRHEIHSDCKECSYGSSGHCEKAEKLQLKVWELMRKIHRKTSAKKIAF